MLIDVNKIMIDVKGENPLDDFRTLYDNCVKQLGFSSLTDLRIDAINTYPRWSKDTQSYVLEKFFQLYPSKKVDIGMLFMRKGFSTDNRVTAMKVDIDPEMITVKN